MFIPIVPFVPHTTIVNKTIVYSDTVLNLKDLGKNIKVNSICDVSKNELESCLEKVFESNPGVVFNTIQYSKENKKVYFYTDKEISLQAYQDSKIITYGPLSNSKQILEEIKRIITQPRNKDNRAISLYDVAMLLKKQYCQLEIIKEKYKNIFDCLVKNKFGYGYLVVIHNFNYETNELHISFGSHHSELDDIYFKKNDDLYVTKSETSRSRTSEILKLLGDDLSKLYDEFIKNRDFKKQINYGFKSRNSQFYVDIGSHGVEIYALNTSIVSALLADFKLSMYSYKNEFEYNCNSANVINELEGNENELFKRIFVKINDCPEWMRVQLYKIRQNQLAEEQRIEDEKKYKEMKKQKRLELRNKIFPFLRNYRIQYNYF